MPKPRMLSVLFILPLLTFCNKSETTTTADNPPAASTTVATTSSSSSTTTSTTTTAALQTTATETGATTGTTATAKTAGIATADGETPGVTVTVTELKRTSGDVVSLKFVLTNGSSQKMGAGYEFVDPEHHIADFASIGGVSLIDPVGKKKYLVARDSGGKCICSQGLKDLAPGSSLNLWAKFPAPPAGVDKIGIVIPHFSPMDDVPISK